MDSFLRLTRFLGCLASAMAEHVRIPRASLYFERCRGSGGEESFPLLSVNSPHNNFFTCFISLSRLPNSWYVFRRTTRALRACKAPLRLSTIWTRVPRFCQFKRPSTSQKEKFLLERSFIDSRSERQEEGF